MNLLERAPYLDQLSKLLDLVAMSQGRTVLISGEAGVGKTALVEQFIHQHAHEIRSLWGACEALFTPRPLGPLYDMAMQIQVQERFLAFLESNPDRSTLFSTFLLELQKGSLSTVVVFEDVHWADEATLDLIKFLGRRIVTLPILLLITYRDHELGRDHPLRSVIGDLPARAVTRIRLLPLSEHAVACLAIQAHHKVDHLYTITGGNPFFVTEVLASDTPDVPLVVRDAVLARITRLSDVARMLLELVSVVPHRIECWLLDTILGLPVEVLEECQNSGILSLEQTTVAFRHELARQAVESTLPPLRLQSLHRQVLQAMLTHGDEPSQAARLVHHALGACDSALTAHYAVLAARQASAQGAHLEAAAHYATALQSADQFSLEQLAELFEGRAYECYLTGQIEEAMQARLETLQIWRKLDRSDQVGQTLLWLSRLNWFLGKSGDAHEYAVKAVALLETHPPEAGLAMAYSNQAHLAMLSGNATEAVHWGEQAIVLAEALGDRATVAHAENNLGAALFATQKEQGLAHLERSLQLALQGGWEEHVARAYANLACCAIKIREYSLAERFLQEGLAYCARHDLDSWRTDLETWQARAHFEHGRWDDAALEITRILDRYRLSVASKIPALVILASIRMRRGDPGSMPLLDEARALALATGEFQRIAPVASAHAEAAWLVGNLERCLAETCAGYDLAFQQTDPWRLGELSIWRWRAGGLKDVPKLIAEPFARQIAGDWQDAADLWARLDCPYERALALMDGDVSAQREALALFEQLGAQPAAALVLQRLRQQGITSIPRGPRPSTRSNRAGLTNRQREVLQLMAEGFSNAEIASRLFTSLKTVDHHVSAVLAKLGVHSRAQAIQIARHLELIPGEKPQD